MARRRERAETARLVEALGYASPAEQCITEAPRPLVAWAVRLDAVYAEVVRGKEER